MKRSTRSRALSMLVVASAMPLFVLGCPKKNTEWVDAGPPPSAVVDAGVTQLTPLDDDGGDDGEAEAEAAPKHTGPAVNVNQARIKQCCNALRKQFGTAPEVQALILTCDNVAAQAGGGTAPEFAAFRQLLKGHTLPATCQGL
jgi:hypothetical protein